jgi:hypothetical protein
MNCFYSVYVTRSQIEDAIARDTPFTLRMADGREYAIPHKDYISLPPKGAYVVVYDDNEHFHVLPLLTMTGLSAKGVHESREESS